MPKKAVLLAVVVLFPSFAAADTVTPFVSSGYTEGLAEPRPLYASSHIAQSDRTDAGDVYLLSDWLTKADSVSDAIPETRLLKNPSEQEQTSLRYPRRQRGVRGKPGKNGGPLTDEQLQPEPVPEPTTLLLLGFGLIGLGVWRRTRAAKTR